MKSKRLSLKIILISALALVMAFSVSALLWGNSARAADGYTLKVQGDVLEGIEVTGSNVSVEIPANVKTVKERAFINQTEVAEITFEAASQLTEIGDAAFNNTGITKIELPASLEKIGAGAFSQNKKLEYVTFGGDSVTEIGMSAFGDCEKLKYVVLPENAEDIDFCKTEGGDFTGNYGGSTFNNSSAYIIAKNRASYDALLEAFEQPASPKAAGDGDDVTVGEAVLEDSEAVVTYPVTVKYMGEGEEGEYDDPLGEEVCLSVDYLTTYEGGVWKQSPTDKIGGRLVELGELTGITWSCNNKPISDVEGATAALNEATGDEIIFCAVEEQEGDNNNRFVADVDIVFDENAYYDIGSNKRAINALITDTIGNGVTSSMGVVITKYAKPDGTVVYPSSDDDEEPFTVIHDAGTYDVTISYTGGSDTLTIIISPKTVNLGEYSNLSWKINGTTDLRNKNLRLYTTTGGAVYPSEDILSSEMISNLGLRTTGYTEKYVYYSVASNTGNATTIAIGENVAYTVKSVTGNTSTRHTYGSVSDTYVGAYLASATIQANDNYVLEYVAADSEESSSRGLVITENGDGTFKVEKTWYVVNVNNRIVYGNNGADYSMAFKSSYTFGEDGNHLPAPQITYNPQSGSAENFISITFRLDGVGIYGTATPSTLNNYVNASMPAGTYTMTIRVAAITDENGERHDGFTESFTFTVNKAEIKGLSAFNNTVKGRTFTYAWENGVSHFYDNTYGADTAWTNFKNSFGVVRTGVWDLERYDSYYADPEIGYKLDNSANAPYYGADILSTAAVQTYRVYYNISVPNYNDFISSLTGETFSAYYFDVINVMTVDTPTIASKTYNGQTLTADVLNSVYYTVETNNGGIDVGTYEVVLRLIDSVHYMWSGQTLENKTEFKSVTFEIVRNPDNGFTVKPRITSWTQGQYNEEENVIEVEALYGSVSIIIVNTADPDNVLYNGANGTDELKTLLKGLKAGSYMITASVAGNDNYTDINDSFILLVFEKDGLPWWAVLLIVVGTLGVVALVFFILHQKGVLQMLMGKVVIAMRAQATIDATIAAVRANKVAAEARKSVAKAEALDRIEQLRAEHKAEMAKPADEQAATLEEKAQVAAKSAEVMQKRAEDIKKRAEAIKYSGAPAQGNTAEQPQISGSEIPEEYIPEDDGFDGLDEDYELPDDGDEE